MAFFIRPLRCPTTSSVNPGDAPSEQHGGASAPKPAHTSRLCAMILPAPAPSCCPGCHQQRLIFSARQKLFASTHWERKARRARCFGFCQGVHLQGSVTDLGSSKGTLLPTQVEDALHVDLRKAVIARTNEVARLYSMYKKNVSKLEGRD